MLKLIILVFSLFGLFSACVGQNVQIGQCDPNIELQENFDIERFLGTWHEMVRTDNPNQRGDCAAFELTSNNDALSVYHSSVTDNFLEEASGTASLVNGTAKLTLNISSFENPIDFWVLSTDYTTFALAASCEDVYSGVLNLNFARVHLWVLGRSKDPLSEMTLAMLNTTINNVFNINALELKTISHSAEDCFTLPVIEPGQPIVLSGQCDPNIPVVQNFDVGRFTGLWHQIASYDSPNSRGSCARAEYSAGVGVVDVLNSHIIDQNLLTIDGFATVSSDDGSAKLSVVLNVENTQLTQELWVLATDYDSYAISYTCVNITNTQKQVFSWILSRTRQMPATSQEEVDQVVNSITDLNYRYYEETNQTDAGCFFYPDPVPSQPVVFRGQCESVNVDAMGNFDAGRYMGLWHNIELYPAPFQTGSNCSNAYYEFVVDRVDVLNTQVINQRLDTINAVAVPVATDGSAKLVVTFPVAGTNLTVSTDYWVLDTDYISYALVYSCFNLNADEMQVGSWKLSRTKQLTTAAENAINSVMNNVTVLDQRYFEVMDQSVEGCFYFPEPEVGVPVVFPGQCDETITVVQNFNFQQFQGVWYEIEAYPKAEQSGQCINHQYTFVNNALLNLVSWSVIDQFLSNTSSAVTFNTTDNSGKLAITLTDANGAAIAIPFWILNTDYTDYALAYSCVNINSDFRGVWSWKLSRTKQLSTPANNVINNAISNIVVLDSVYYEDIDQSDRACFYLPELEAGESVILPGQCNNSITGVPNFNIQRFAGRWRLIESYGSEFQVGTCNEDRYTQTSNNALDITNSQVVNQELSSISGSATVSSTDGTGELLFYFPSRNEYFEYKVLDTDYESYALGYGCVNLNTEQRRVYSWKLSRDNTLSQAATNNINQIINSIEVLNNRYFYVVNRTNSGCFYYPEVVTNATIRFRGECDENIPVVTNFDAARYLGLWHDIESYPVDAQDGTCNNAFYSPGNDVDVYNTQVINETLFSIRGSASLIPSTDGSAKLNVTFEVGGVNLTVNYWVLSTDYDSYSFVYSCQPIDDEYVTVSSWKLSRTKSLTTPAETAINNVMNTIPVLDQRYFLLRDQTPEGCFYYPEPQLGVEVVFPGQCDNTIAAQPNFDMTRFQGQWYEIQAYPKDDQPGQCVNHQFTINGTNSLDMLSSNVVNQALGITSGNVTFNTVDGSGRLTITFTSANGTVIEIPYWVLSTDYTNYALVYSCVNIGSDFRGIWSWKLSRSKTLSDAANTTINNAMSNINVLDNVYYEDIQQSDDACFYYPELGPNDPVVFPGQCDPNIPVVQNFDAARYLGRWRLIENYGSDFQTGTCDTATYSLAADGSVIVFNEQVIDQQLYNMTGSAVPATTDGSGKLVVTFPTNTETIELWILDTDYDSYALAYSCVNISSDQRRVWSWKMSRTNTLTVNATNNINQVVDRIDVLDSRYYQTVNRTDAGCFYFPEPNNNATVRFRGQCNESIPVVTNFDVGRYLGLWHDIESYPVPFQDGSCPNAFYAPFNSTSVTVYNTHVVDQSLGVINGIATVAVTDGTAKLDVTFNVLGFNVTTSYWVLDTDYDNYAFVYSCANIDDEFMSIATWKLSRTKSLTQAATTAINNIMNNYNILDQRYYIDRDQSPDGCFYFPEPQPGVPVVFPGQCDDNIAAVPSFNMNLFQGIWHEVAAYPKEEQTGQCISHQFRVNTANSLLLDSFNVLNQNLLTTSGQVTFNTTDGTGKLMINIVADGETITIPYWILSIDYTDYALAYSCVNISSDFRGIWSWKLSRSKTLSNAANTTINNAISNINVLDNVYYEDIQQSDDACFYYPELGPNDPVVFPGQCDPNIPVVQNFDAARYLGRWRLIENYGSDFQTGTCDTATYSLAADGSVIVFNEQVIDQQLYNMTGSAVPATTDGSGKLVVTFPTNTETIELWILDTDYDSYALAYSCVNISSDQRRVWSWKMSRTNTLTVNATNSINQVVDRIDVLDSRYYQTVNRTDAGCFYFPEPNNNATVRFRGQCDESIPVVTNFDVGRYLGLWHDIESYPVPFQDGSCPNAFYAPFNSTSVTVYNTHVVDQSLGVINGIATVAVTDGTAKLDVTFNVLGFNVTTSYWVLDTDYDNYAFVYSCANIDDEFMSIATWKLSRTKSLTQAATTAIDNIMNNYNILDQRYYINRDQSPDGCFYFPEPQPGVPVVFPGQCDDNIAAVPSFNMNLFQGIWHEVAAYPKEEQTGQCISHQFRVNTANSLLLDSFNVLNQNLLTTSGQVTFNTTDGTGKLMINIVADGETISIPYWILSTDYTDYALAYSCVNISSDFRGIWSWKLSRNKTLSNAANTTINNAISNINVLDNVYYEDIQQSDDVCFYYPELGPNDPVVFPGQCDPNIPVVQNFDAARYLGRWRLIENYGSDFQTGTCDTATYSLAADGSVIVFNEQVIDQQLYNMTGSAVPATTDGSGKLVVTFPTNTETIELWILDTDYDSYALAYSCVNISSDQRRVWSWKMSRTNTLTVNGTNSINQVVDRIDVLDDRYYQTVNRTDAGCFYYPTPNDNSVIFPGQCEENIPVVAGFNAVAYEGTWYDVESYPSLFQTGTCSTARYTINPDLSVQVVNTQVIDQVLRTMNGTAVVASTDGTAKLDVTFNVDGVDVTTKYWVLATDYISYSYVYSCRNIDEETRQVYSWKLGRQTTLPAAAITAINNVMNTVQVLDQQYYAQQNHTEEACFYYPDNNGGDVILNGQCVPDAEVPAITNFNQNAFVGTWHEVARFPSTIQNGECTATQYSLAGVNTFGIVQTDVINEELYSTITQATVASDNRGVISTGGSMIPFNDVYILATDYNEYALAYACRNLTDSTKQIFSWKFSRSRSGLSDAANNVIDEIVRNNIDLFELYYRYTSQDHAACFYYPEFDSPQAVIELPGPCNDTIRAVPDFNVYAYLGRWFEVARYPEPSQIGQCNRVEYSDVNANGGVVTNTQVIDMILNTTRGVATNATNDGSGLFSVSFEVGTEVRSSNYYILATDYNTYSLLYTCTNLENGNRQVGSWKLSRNRELSTQANAVMDSVIRETQGLRENYYQTTSQSDEDCFYVPEVNPSLPVVFIGQCEDITGVAGFDINRYLGWWHEIEGFPADRVVGDCVSSRYEASGNTFQAVDTSILGNSSSTLTSTVTITSEGRLRRVLSDNSVQDIWVLATDYDTYALLYSCENVDSEYRRVWSAKHSKTRTLNQAAQDAMAPIIENNRVLYPQFYLPVDQSDEACFHYPTQTGSLVILPGQCDQNIPVERNFDMADFQGTWYQIQRYDAVQDSTCIGTRYVYDPESSNIEVLEYEVVNGDLRTREGTGQVASTDGSARLSIVLPVDGTNETVTTNLYILTTDYENYALAYSCVNVDEYHRQVGAWQLSRTRTMPASGSTAINAVITQREELHLPYFNQISQDSECPEPSSAFLFKSSIIAILACVVLQLVL